MKILPLIAAFASLGTAAVASSPHNHHHVHKREALPAVYTEVVTVPVNYYEYDGKILSEEQVCEGINNGLLKWAPGSVNPPDCQKGVAAAGPVSTSVVHAPVASSTAEASFEQAAGQKQEPKSTLIPVPSLASVAASVVIPTHATASVNTLPSSHGTSAADTSVVASSSPVASSGSSSTGSTGNCDVEFPDGQIDCSTFPSEYGPLDISWMNLGGWSGVQTAVVQNNIITGLATTIAGGSGCSPGSAGATTFCSYACPPGYQKSQWPSTQGAASMAVSVGGLMCGPDNKLYLTNAALSKNLCIEGTGKTFVQNSLNNNAAICRTDYPGTEDETVPLDSQAGQNYPLTCPDSSTYYQHLGAQTSAQYYVNPAGVSVEKACIWGQDGTDQGNWAPVVIGVETDSDGNTWLSIMTTRQNDPSSYVELNYSIEILGDFGGDNGCYYTPSNNIGYYCNSGRLADFTPGAAGCRTFDPTNDPVPGCTVQLMSGTATYNLVETAN